MLLEAVFPGISRSPRMLVEERHALVCLVYLVTRVGAVFGQSISDGVHGLGRPYISLGATVEAELASPGSYAVDPPVGPVARVGIDAPCKLLFSRGEELAVDRQAQPGIGPLLVPFAYDPGRHYARGRVIRESALDPQVEHIVGIRLFGHFGVGVQASPPEDVLPAPLVRVGTLREGRKIAWQRLGRGLVIPGQADQVALHVRAPVRGIRGPHQEALAVGRAPVEGTREFLTADQVGGRTARVVVGHGQVAHVRVDQGSKEADRRPWHVGLHGRLYGHLVALAQFVGEAQLACQLVDRIRLGVHAEGEGADLYASLANAVEEPAPVTLRPALDPVQQRPGGLYVPTELRVFRPVVGGRGEVEDRVQILQVMLKYRTLGVGVADVEVRMVDEKDRPFALGTDFYPRLERLPGPGLDPKGKRPGLVDLGDEEIQDRAALVDPGPGRIQESISVGDRKGYVSGRSFGQHHQPQDLR